ncbi:MAG: penicillin-binding protein 2 [Anaerolineae bacterium]|nr:penicillin-binding protein 2 [Anaerolineae bacterium]
MKPRPLFNHPRTLAFRGVIVIVFAILAFRLWQLQMVQHGEFRVKADDNRSRLVDLDAPRGVIYDRYGRTLARNRPSFNVSVIPGDLPDDEMEEEAVLRRLASILAGETTTVAGGHLPTSILPQDIEPRRVLTLDEMQARIADAREHVAFFRPIVVATHVSQTTAFIVEEEALELPGVQLQVVPIRDYVTGALTAHLIGYTGPIPAEEVSSYQAQGYGPLDQVGRIGLELSYEEELRGTKGRKHSIVNANGREVRTVGQPIPAIPGRNLVLSLDLELQRAMEQALSQGMVTAKSKAGVAIAMDPRNGDILGMVSLPAYDNNLFAKSISPSQYNALVTDPLFPLFNRAVGGVYPPGSTFKIIPAAAGLQEGVITKRTLINDPGIIWLPNQFYPNDPKQAQPFVCWIWKYQRGHGMLNVVGALAQSCDVFFYQVGGGYQAVRGLGEQTLAEYTREFGLGELTSIDLPGESRGLVPDPKWKRLQYAENWVTGDTYNMSIGQGYVLATPLQILNALAAVANGGYLYQPRLVSRLTNEDGQVVHSYAPRLIREIPVTADSLAIVREGLFGAVNWDYGTANGARLPDVAVAGKTGTAEYPGKRDEKGNLPTHAWFIAFAPYEEPEIAVVVFLEGGGEGSTHAVPIAAKILRAYFYGEQPQSQPAVTPTPVATPTP